MEARENHPCWRTRAKLQEQLNNNHEDNEEDSGEVLNNNDDDSDEVYLFVLRWSCLETSSNPYER